MKPPLQHLTSDLLRRAWPSLLLMGLVELCNAFPIIVGGEQRIPQGAILMNLWILIPFFLFQRNTRLLRTMPLTTRSIGRWAWWCIFGACSLATIAMLAITIFFATFVGHRTVNLGLVLQWLVVSLGVSWCAIASWLLSSPSRSNVVALYSYFALAVVALWLRAASPFVVIALAVPGFAFVAFAYRNPERMFMQPSRDKRVLKRAASYPWLRIFEAPTRLGLLSLVAQSGLWTVAIIAIVAAASLLAIRLGFIPDVATDGIKSVFTLTLFICAGIPLVGFIFVLRCTLTIRSLRSLPLSAHHLTLMLALTSVVPTVIVATLAWLTNLYWPITSASTLVFASMHIIGMSMLLPAWLMSESTTLLVRLACVISGVLFLAIGLFLIAIGYDTFVWLSGPSLGLIGYLWAHRAIVKNSFTYRSRWLEFEQLRLARAGNLF